MKKERYFCDWVDEPIEGSRKTRTILVTILSLMIIPIISLICYKSIMIKYEDQIKNYINTTYETVDNRIILSEEDLDVSTQQENKKLKKIYSTTEMYMSFVKGLIILESITFGMIVYLLIGGTLFVVSFIAKYISKLHKIIDNIKISS